jgi:PAS domain S-box-containing protein
MSNLKERIVDLENKYRIVADNLIDAIWIIDADTLKYEYITPSIERISGFTADEIMTMTGKDRLTPESLTEAAAALVDERKRFEKGRKGIRKLELELTHKDGSYYWIEVRARFIKDTDKPPKIIGVSRDITERKKIEHKQNELIKQLGEALAEKDRLLKEVKVLRGLLPICSGCKRIRDEQGRWWPLDAYIRDRTEAKLTHTICPDCDEVYYGDLK